MTERRRITIFDTTLRDGEQSPGASMNLPEKLEIAQLCRILVWTLWRPDSLLLRLVTLRRCERFRRVDPQYDGLRPGSLQRTGY